MKDQSTLKMCYRNLVFGCENCSLPNYFFYSRKKITLGEKLTN